MKKLLVLLTAVVMVALLCTPLSARKESDTVLIHDADTSFGGFSLDGNEMTEGDASLSVTLRGESFVADHKLRSTVDISGCDTIALDLYISDVDQLAGINSMFFEISSSGTCDEEELQWEYAGSLRANAVEDGWNTVYLDIPTASVVAVFDETAVNYLRFYTFHSAAANGLVLKLDNIRACYTGGEDFSDMELDAYQGNNPNAEVVIAGQSVPNPDQRDEGITKVAGYKK